MFFVPGIKQDHGFLFVAVLEAKTVFLFCHFPGFI
jgi:hypothetical protein